MRTYCVVKDRRTGERKIVPYRGQACFCTISEYELMQMEIEVLQAEAWLKAQEREKSNHNKDLNT